MECEQLVKNGRGRNQSAPTALRRRGVKRESGGGVRPAGPASLAVVAAGPQLPRTPRPFHPVDLPFMSDMDEISYWIYTKRAPCLLSYDNEIKKQNEDAQCSKPKSPSIVSINDDSPLPRKKKRKLTVLDDDSTSIEKQQNIYFETSHGHNQKTMPSRCKTSEENSNIDFNIKNETGNGKHKQTKLQKNNTAHKKSKPFTSTPKPTVRLRRSLRTTQKNNQNSKLNNSFDFSDASIVNGNVKGSIIALQKSENSKLEDIKSKKPIETQASIDHGVNNIDLSPKPAVNTFVNKPFEDLSDVSGFTASYIRSTRLNSSRTPRTLRNKSGRNLIKESQNAQRQGKTIVVSVNKSVNTGLAKGTLLNCSTDSSPNIVNLVSKEDNGKSTKVKDKCTSLLKFMDAKVKTRDLRNKSDGKQTNKLKLNTSFLSQSSGTSRYPKRYNNTSVEHKELTSTPMSTRKNNTNKRRKVSKNSSELENSERKENPEEKSMSRTRSGKSCGLTIRQPENSVLVLSNSTEHASSVATINVANPSTDKQKKKKRSSPRLRSAKKTVNKSVHSNANKKTSVREKSGFTACFGDSDDDEPLIRSKYF